MVPGSLGSQAFEDLRHSTVSQGGVLTREHGVLESLLGHHVSEAAEDGLQGVAQLHQVLGFPRQAVLLLAAGEGRPRGAECT